MTGRPGRRTLVAAVLALGLGCLSACDQGSASTVRERPPVATGPTTYAALGDSYTSAPFVPTTDVAGGCFRASGNYPSLVARELDPQRFVDVSCAGADTADLTGPQSVAGGQGEVPPQLRSLPADADLVTLGIGGNDGELFSSLVCGYLRDTIAQCAGQAPPEDLDSLLEQTGKDVRRSLRRIRRIAPDAFVVLVGYPRLVDPLESCDGLPIAEDELATVSVAEQRLRATLRRAARRAGVTFLDLFPESLGHEICSDDPWVNGVRTDRARALAFHPFAAEQEATAELVVALWRERLDEEES